MNIASYSWVGSVSGLNRRNIGLYTKVLRKTAKEIVKNSACPGWYVKPGPPNTKEESNVL
jgi:hypothetical protein